MGKWWLALVLALMSAGSSAADVNAVVRETQWNLTQGARNVLFWWMPGEFFRLSFQSQPGMTPAMIDSMIKNIDQYVIVGVIDVDVTGIGIVGGRDGDAVRQQLKLTDSSGKALVLVPDAELNKDVRNLLAVMKPGIAGMLGPMGEHLQFAVYQGKNADGNRILNPLAAGSFVSEYAGVQKKWRLPLGSLLPSKLDADTGESFPGDFIFSPYTGKKLQEKI